jgi:hypothetical protein
VNTGCLLTYPSPLAPDTYTPGLSPPPTQQDAEAGDRTLHVACCADGLQAGEMVRLLMSDPGDGSLMGELHANAEPIPRKQLGE